MTATPTCIEIDTAAIAHNLGAVRDELGPHLPLCAVVKADAYGHGLDLVLPVLLSFGVTAIGVTSNDEAAAARAGGFRGRILRLRTALREEIEDGARHDIEEWVGGGRHAEVVAAAARAVGGRIRIHVSLNSTGLSRDGIHGTTSDAARSELERIAADPHLRPTGVCSHFPCEDADDVADGARTFAEESRRAAAILGGRRSPGVERHCATSFAALTVPASRFDLVRIGAALYGDTSASGVDLRPAMRVVSRIAAVNDYPAGSTVGYDRTHRLRHPSRLAVVPLGYADGYSRALGGRAHVLIHGTPAPVVDRLAMNTLVVDVTQVPEARIGDDVVLYGRQGDATISSLDLERASGQIAANLYTAWGRLSRRVVAEGTAHRPRANAETADEIVTTR
ncbi:alanine racemase [Microbacterium mangrovi]|uniref:alanine racemase n=1 Tax=Microbacterium mangrovi TaxID=1348253 RepID=UPI00068D06C6|nr:alanine racemase [Microbacterium mangrovi]